MPDSHDRSLSHFDYTRLWRADTDRQTQTESIRASRATARCISSYDDADAL